MNALHRAQQIAGRLDEVADARKYEEEAAAMQTKLELLRAQRSALHAAAQTAAALVKNEALSLSTLPAVAPIRDALARLAESFEGDSRTLTSGRSFAALMVRLESATKALSEASSAAWKAVTSTAPRANEKLLGRIEQVPGHAESVRQLRAAAKAFEETIRTAPRSQADWNTYADLRARVEMLIATLNSDRFPQEVLDFCKRAQSREGAPLDHLTPAVREWLEENKMYEELRLRLL